MKTRMLLIAFFTLLLPLVTFAAPITRLHCPLEGMKIESVTVSEYQGRLFLITKPYDGDMESRILDPKQWDYRMIEISNTSELQGVVYKYKDQWFFALKDSSGWSSSGNVSCMEN